MISIKITGSVLVLEEKSWVISVVITTIFILFFIWGTWIEPQKKVWELWALLVSLGFFPWYLAFRRTAVFDKRSGMLKFDISRFGWRKYSIINLSDISSVEVLGEPSDISGTFYKTVIVRKDAPPLVLTSLGYWGKDKHQNVDEAIGHFLSDMDI